MYNEIPWSLQLYNYMHPPPLQWHFSTGDSHCNLVLSISSHWCFMASNHENPFHFCFLQSCIELLSAVVQLASEVNKDYVALTLRWKERKVFPVIKDCKLLVGSSGLWIYLYITWVNVIFNSGYSWKSIWPSFTVRLEALQIQNNNFHWVIHLIYLKCPPKVDKDLPTLITDQE